MNKDIGINILTGLFIILLAGCAQVPKESVDLSATVGRDIAVAHKAHAELAQLLFKKMRQDINRFIDDTYAPYLINATMARQKELANSSDPDQRRKSLLLAINAAFKPGASERLQSKVLKGMGSMVRKIHTDVENKRAELLTPLNEQEEQVIGSINRAYNQMHYANSIVTGHLASVAKVHQAQSEMLAEFGIERNLRAEVGQSIASASETITSIVDKAEAIDKKIENAEDTAKSLKETIINLKTSLSVNKGK